MRKLPIGVDNFHKMISNGYEYVDKTMFIKEIIDKGSEVSLILRPRRFGKTIMLSMLESYFSAQEYEKNKDIFAGLNILKCEEEITSMQGKSPVINITLKELKANNWKDNYERLKEIIAKLYIKNEFLIDTLKDYDVKYFNRILNGKATQVDIEQSLLKLTRMLHDYYKKNVIVLIDEYDMVYETSYANNGLSECLDTINALLGNALKTNEYLEFSVITGILRISKESIFSELNNISVNTVMKDSYTNYFGFTKNEVEKLLEKSGLLEKKEEVALWYNGYSFGKTQIYNPWSILSYLDEKGKIGDYWVNTGSNRVLTKVIMGATEESYKLLQQLILGEDVEIEYNEKIVYSDLTSSIHTILSFLFMAGYVTLSEKKSENIRNIYVKISNYEVKMALESMITGIFVSTGTSETLNRFKNSVLTNNKELMEDSLQKILEKNLRCYDNVEALYHGVILGMLIQLGDEYTIQSNMQSGLGRYDVAINKGTEFGVIFEFKVKTKRLTSKLDTLAQNALEQIEDNEYDKNFKNIGITKIYKHGIAFSTKKVIVK